MNAALPLGLLIGLVAAPLPASAQGFGNGWLAFQNDDSRMVSAPELGLGDTEERDYAHADLNNDGWTDLVVVRKEPLHTTGGRYNVLFMNVGGTLLDRTLQYASASTVPGDRGFLTETNDRDVVICDVDQDGWLDVVTATTLSPNLPKAVSHPRVYLNLGPDTGGAWLGLRYEEARIPELLLSDGTPSWPRFTAVDAGDLTGDGFPDLYFGDNDQAPHFDGGDMGDRLLVNDGTGHFVDESLLRMTPDLLTSLYTTSVVIADVSLDGLQDVVRDRGYSPFVSTAYNNPANPGYFELMDEVHNNQPYYTSVGDLNRDGRPELVISNNEADRYRINEGTLGSGLVQWSLPVVFQFLTGGDDGYAGDNYIVDLDA
ncbi:MAG TPA: VCBS repeat-containing protein, partial [Planctomycetota bacterium]|nr:VCBS repeat-containing protein [Planctomycetota bacterium]